MLESGFSGGRGSGGSAGSGYDGWYGGGGGGRDGGDCHGSGYGGGGSSHVDPSLSSTTNEYYPPAGPSASPYWYLNCPHGVTVERSDTRVKFIFFLL